ncbi:MAG: hypothetical protein WDN28_01120 [Chthoniobacter sp.]
MNTQNRNIHPAPSDSSAHCGITILYEDRATGLRAKRFSDMLAVSLGDLPPADPACWRLELIDLPALTDDISRDAAASEFLVLSLRGDTSLSRSSRQWLEALLENAERGTMSLIALFDPMRSVAPHADGLRCYLRQVTAQSGIAFFAHCSATPDDDRRALTGEDAESALGSKPRRGHRRFAESVFPTTMLGSLLPAAMTL